MPTLLCRQVMGMPACMLGQEGLATIMHYGSGGSDCCAVRCAQTSTKDKEEELRKMQEKFGVDGEQHPKGKQ